MSKVRIAGLAAGLGLAGIGCFALLFCLAGGIGEDATKAEGLKTIAAADSVATLKAALGERFNGFGGDESGELYIYRDKSWVAVWSARMETEHSQGSNWYYSLARDSDGEWFECDKRIGALYQLQSLDPRSDAWTAQDARLGDVIASASRAQQSNDRFIYTLTTGPNLGAARHALSSAGFRPFDPHLNFVPPKITVTADDITAPRPLTADEKAARDQFMRLNGVITQQGDTFVAGCKMFFPFTDEGMALLVHWPSLGSAVFSQSQISDVGLHYLRGMKQLRELGLQETAIGDAGIQEISQLQSLEILNLDKTHISDAGLVYLSNLKSLRELDISRNPQITALGLEAISHLTSLRKLELEETSISDASLEVIGAMDNLEYLDLSGTPITDEEVGHLKGMSHLTTLLLCEQNLLTDSALNALRNLPSLRYLGLFPKPPRMSDAAIADFQKQNPILQVSYQPGQ